MLRLRQACRSEATPACVRRFACGLKAVAVALRPWWLTVMARYVVYRVAWVFWGWELLPVSGRDDSGVALTAGGARAAARAALAGETDSAQDNARWLERVRVVAGLTVAALCLAGAAYLLANP